MGKYKEYLKKHWDLKKRVDQFADDNRWAICGMEEDYKNFSRRLLAFITTEIDFEKEESDEEVR